MLIPTSLILVGLGFWMVDEGNWSLGDFWVSFGLGVWIFSFILGSTYLGPTSGRYKKLATEEGPDSPAAAAMHGPAVLRLAHRARPAAAGRARHGDQAVPLTRFPSGSNSGSAATSPSTHVPKMSTATAVPGSACSAGSQA